MIYALLMQAAVPPATASAPVPAPWSVTTRTEGVGTATTTSAWSADTKARLVVRCDAAAEKIVSIQFIPRAGFAAALPRPVSINADDGGWLGSNWQFPGSGAFVSDDVIVSNLAVTIAHGRSIRVRAIDPTDVPVEATFAGPGEAPVRRVLAACGYVFGVAPPRAPVPAPVRDAAPAEEQ